MYRLQYVREARLKELKQELLNSNQILLWVGDVGQKVVKHISILVLLEPIKTVTLFYFDIFKIVWYRPNSCFWGLLSIYFKK